MEILLGILTILVVSAIIVDWLHSTVSKSSEQSELLPMKSSRQYLLNELTARFVKLFYLIYGHRAWTWRRVGRSVLLSLLFIFYSFLIVGTEQSVLLAPIIQFQGWPSQEVALVLGIVLVANFVADFVSLEETRWIMETVKRERGTSSFFYWVCIDLLLTTFIYFLLVVPALFVGFYLVVDAEVARYMFSSPDVLKFYVEPRYFLPLFISTYGTSIVWFLYVATMLLGKHMSGKYRIMQVGLSILLESRAPARLVALLIGLAIGIFFCLGKAIQWLVNLQL